jgi:hypothetical protein
VVLALAGALLGVLGWWFSKNFGFTTERTYVGYSGEARSNPFYAAGLLLQRMGKQVKRQVVLASVDQLPAGATVILPDHRVDLGPPQVKALLDWVKRGGTLVVSGQVDWFRKDPLLEALGVTVRERDTRDADAPSRACSAPDADQSPAKSDEIQLPDGRVLHAELERTPVLEYEGEDVVWRHPARHGDRILVLERGSGSIEVISSLRLFTNRTLDQRDHAALLWFLLADTGREVVLVQTLQSLSLLEWLREHALAALAALGVLVALWLWRVVPRFGPLRPAQAAPRRSLLEHLRAVGRFEADAQQLGRLLQQVRADTQSAFERSAPLAAALEGPARLREASRLTGLRPRELMQAFAGRAATRQEFSNTVRTLAAFRRRLARRLKRELTR